MGQAKRRQLQQIRPAPAEPTKVLDGRLQVLLDLCELALKSGSLRTRLLALRRAERIVDGLRAAVLREAQEATSWAAVGLELGITRQGAFDLFVRSARRADSPGPH